MSGEPDPLYVAARRVLLDALDALGVNAGATILIGAQAIYLHTGDADLAVSEFTTDGDLALEPARLEASPLIADAMSQHGFEPGDQPGSWLRSVDGLPQALGGIDFHVPEALAPGGRRGARLGVHGKRTARKARGLEAAVIDNAYTRIAALDETDEREFDIRVANPPALLVAKLHKLGDRTGDPRRERDKDALDVLRLLRATPTAELAAGLRRLGGSELAADVTTEAVNQLDRLFASPDSAGTLAAVRAAQPLESPDTIAASAATLAGRLLDAIIARGR